MVTSALREVVIGVSDLDARARFYEEALGLAVLSRGRVAAPAAATLFGRHEPVETIALGRPDVPGGVRLRLVSVRGEAPRPDKDLTRAGPLGVGFTTRGIERVFARLSARGVDFVSPPLRLTPDSVGPTGPVRYEAFGRAADGELVVLIERINAPAPYGVISVELDTSEPLHVSHVVRDLPACSRFLREALSHETLFREQCAGEPFVRLMGLRPDARFRFEMLHHPGYPTGRTIFIEYDGGARPSLETDRGIFALRYDCDDLEAARTRGEAAGGAVLDGPVELDEPSLGAGRALIVRPPFLTRLLLWQAR